MQLDNKILDSSMSKKVITCLFSVQRRQCLLALGSGGVCDQTAEFCSYLPDWQVKFRSQKNYNIINPVHKKTFFGQVEMTFRLVPEWPAVKMTFFAPCFYAQVLDCNLSDFCFFLLFSNVQYNGHWYKLNYFTSYG